MDAVLADGGDRLKSKRLPVGEDGGAKGTLGRVSWIRGAQHLPDQGFGTRSYRFRV